MKSPLFEIPLSFLFAVWLPFRCQLLLATALIGPFFVLQVIHRGTRRDEPGDRIVRRTVECFSGTAKNLRSTSDGRLVLELTTAHGARDAVLAGIHIRRPTDVTAIMRHAQDHVLDCFAQDKGGPVHIATADNIWINGTLVELGLCAVDERAAPDGAGADLQRLEILAKTQRRGIWARPDNPSR